MPFSVFCSVSFLYSMYVLVKKSVHNRTVSKYLILVTGISALLLAVLKLSMASKFEQISEYV